MPEIVGIRFKSTGPVHYFDPAGLEIEVNDYVVVKTSHGPMMGAVVISPKQVLESEVADPLKPVLRKAEEEDFNQEHEARAKEKEALARCKELVNRFHLPMKLIAAEYNLDGSHLTIYFGAEGRVDFRPLLRELSAALRTRVELKQVGARDEAKIIGGFGRCGRPLCCANHLCAFESISMRMAKEQGLPLNPEKISGLCGRLLCCLRYENAQYQALREKLPRMGQSVTTPSGPAKVVGTNPLKEMVLVQLESDALLELPLSEVALEERRGENPPRKR